MRDERERREAGAKQAKTHKPTKNRYSSAVVLVAKVEEAACVRIGSPHWTISATG